MNTKQKLTKIIESGLTQEVIASRTGITQPTISRILAGKHADVKASTADSISILYNSLLGGKQAA